MQRKTNDIIDYALTETNLQIEQNNNMFSIHSNQQFPVFWDLENSSIVNVLVELKNKYQYNNDLIYKQAIDINK